MGSHNHFVADMVAEVSELGIKGGVSAVGATIVLSDVYRV
jgi:hypothetical protein